MAQTNGIGGSPLLQTLMSQTESVSAGSKKGLTGPGATAGTAHQDRMQLSTTANALLHTASSNSDVRTEKVAALQSAIASGTYNVSASDVADSVLRNLLK